MASSVMIDGPLARVTFDRFDLESYALFLQTKKLPESQLTYDWAADQYEVTTPARFAGMLGAEVPTIATERGPLSDHLFDYQAWAVAMALDAKRFAIWADTGLGKTAMYLEWVRQVQLMTEGRVLILAPIAIHNQIIYETARFYGFDCAPIRILQTRDELVTWCKEGTGTGICNYEKFIPGVIPELRYLAGVVADESGILKTGGGTIKWNLIKSARGVEYKLSCTATPAPNEAMEYASQAAFLEKLRNEGDILWTYFQRDRHGTWFVKPHAQAAFYAFMASWSLYMRDPAAFGFEDILATLPPPVMTEERIPMTTEQVDLYHEFAIQTGKGLFAEDRLGVKERAKLAQVARGFVYEGSGKDRTIRRVKSAKVDRVIKAVSDFVAAGHQVLIWTTFDEEGAVIDEGIPEPITADGSPGKAVLTGYQSQAERDRILWSFRAGTVRILISKPSLIGYGLNLQFVTAMVFSGIDDSMERRYQAIRRAYRYGQTEPVHVFTPYIPELEGAMFANVAQKEVRFLQEVAAQEQHYRKALGR